MAASNTAIGRTRAGLPDISTPITVKPGRIQSLRYVAYVDGTDAMMNLYWHMPANYPATEAEKANNCSSVWRGWAWTRITTESALGSADCDSKCGRD